MLDQLSDRIRQSLVLRACVVKYDSGPGRQIFIVLAKFLGMNSNVGIKERKLKLVPRLEIQALLRDDFGPFVQTGASI